MSEESASETSEILELIKKQRNKYLIRISILIPLNIILFAVIPLDGRQISERFWVALPAYTIYMNITGFLLGLLMALIPYKRLSYGKRYFRASLLTILVLNLILLAMVVLTAIMFLINHFQ